MKKHSVKSVNAAMRKHNKNIKTSARTLVECILNKDPLTANKIFPTLVSESEQLRELEVKKLLFEDDDWGDDDTGDDEGSDDDSFDDDEDSDEGDDTDDTDNEDAGDESEDDTADADTDKVIDDAMEIQCQINAKIIENLFDKIADLKNILNSKDLDESSKEYITLDITIAYYSDKLQELQTQTNPGTDQTKLEEKLDIISKALDELKDKADEDGSGDDDVEAPEDVEDSEGEGDEDESDDEFSDDEDADEGSDEDDQSDGTDDAESEDEGSDEDDDFE